MFFFFKQKTAYEMRISDWSSDVCSSDLGSTSYPIMGTSNYLTYTCYRSSSNRTPLQTFMNWYVNNRVLVDLNHGILAKSGFGAVPLSWRKAITDTFVKDTYGLGLTMATRGQTAYCPSTIYGG